MSLRTPCRDCGALVDVYGRARPGLCGDCASARAKHKERGHYRSGWNRKSRRMRRRVGRCQECGAAGVALELDHVTPRSEEGGLRVLCRSCHRAKTGGKQ